MYYTLYTIKYFIFLYILSNYMDDETYTGLLIYK